MAINLQMFSMKGVDLNMAELVSLFKILHQQRSYSQCFEQTKCSTVIPVATARMRRLISVGAGSTWLPHLTIFSGSIRVHMKDIEMSFARLITEFQISECLQAKCAEGRRSFSLQFLCQLGIIMIQRVYNYFLQY